MVTRTILCEVKKSATLHHVVFKVVMTLLKVVLKKIVCQTKTPATISHRLNYNYSYC